MAGSGHGCGWCGLVGVWAKGLVADTGKILLDARWTIPWLTKFGTLLKPVLKPGTRVSPTCNVWRVGKQVYAYAMTVVTHDGALTPDAVRKRLSVHEEIVHSTIEIHYCRLRDTVQ